MDLHTIIIVVVIFIVLAHAAWTSSNMNMILAQYDFQHLTLIFKVQIQGISPTMKILFLLHRIKLLFLGAENISLGLSCRILPFPS